MEPIKRGDLVVVTDAFGEQLRRRATSSLDPGDEFPVVWACREEEWESAQAEEREPESTPWPAEDVAQVAEPVNA